MGTTLEETMQSRKKWLKIEDAEVNNEGCEDASFHYSKYQLEQNRIPKWNKIISETL